MIIRGGTTVFRALRDDWFTLFFFISLTVGAEFIYEYFPLKHTSLPSLPLGVLITAMSIFLAFQINQCLRPLVGSQRIMGATDQC